MRGRHGSTLKVGTHSNGQGHETTYAQIAADALGLPIEGLHFRQGDTDDLDSGGTAMAARARCTRVAPRC